MSERARGVIRLFTELSAPIEKTEEELSVELEQKAREFFKDTGWEVTYASVER